MAKNRVTPQLNREEELLEGEREVLQEGKDTIETRHQIPLQYWKFHEDGNSACLVEDAVPCPQHRARHHDKHIVNMCRGEGQGRR